ncbi:hypothetical protein [Nocardioides sp. GXQ0305]|uniref:hypothetical protein n=1 Tax=Nocardioides sp. GXQ0305 TaxID=3423912 RepID=UPI003D7C4BB4
MSWRHPSDSALGRWSSGGRSWRAARHAQHCPLCLERLELITELEPRLRAELETGLAPQSAWEQTLWDRLEARLADHEAFAVFTDLMDVGPETSWMLLTGPADDGGDND